MKCQYLLIVRHLVISLSHSAQFFSCITSSVNSHGIKLQESLLLVKRKLPQILIVENARQEAESLAQNVKMSWQVPALRAAQIIDGAKETGKTQESKIIAGSMMKLNAWKKKPNQDIALKAVWSTCWR